MAPVQIKLLAVLHLFDVWNSETLPAISGWFQYQAASIVLSPVEQCTSKTTGFNSRLLSDELGHSILLQVMSLAASMFALRGRFCQPHKPELINVIRMVSPLDVLNTCCRMTPLCYKYLGFVISSHLRLFKVCSAFVWSPSPENSHLFKL